jgi:hypothetical protein
MLKCVVCGWPLKNSISEVWCQWCWNRLRSPRCTSDEAARMLELYWPVWQQSINENPERRLTQV